MLYAHTTYGKVHNQSITAIYAELSQYKPYIHITCTEHTSECGLRQSRKQNGDEHNEAAKLSAQNYQY